jgi:hypothetical protein
MTTKPSSMPDVRIGQIRTFGTEGPMYEVTGNGHPAEGGDWLVPIRVVGSGEQLEYPYSQLALDPEAA